MRIARFEDIEAWQLARQLTRKIYDLTRKTKFARDFGLRAQIQDAAGSSMHNIAEGFDSESNPEFVRFLRYAKRSCTEAQIRYPDRLFHEPPDAASNVIQSVIFAVLDAHHDGLPPSMSVATISSIWLMTVLVVMSYFFMVVPSFGICITIQQISILQIGGP